MYGSIDVSTSSFYKKTARINSKQRPKNIVMWRQVLGYIQQHLPACYAQTFYQGLYGVVDYNEKLHRSLKSYYHHNAVFFPLNSNLCFRLGYEYACGTAAGDDSGNSEDGVWTRAQWRSGCFSRLMSSKNSSTGKPMQRPDNQSKKRTGCIVM